MELKDTIKLMLSDDWRDRLKAEYWQTVIRLRKLHTYNINLEAFPELQDKLDSPAWYLVRQEEIMREYLYYLELRAVKSGIDLTE